MYWFSLKTPLRDGRSDTHPCAPRTTAASAAAPNKARIGLLLRMVGISLGSLFAYWVWVRAAGLKMVTSPTRPGPPAAPGFTLTITPFAIEVMTSG